MKTLTTKNTFYKYFAAIPAAFTPNPDDFGLNYGESIGLGDRSPIEMIISLVRIALSFLALFAVLIIMLGGFKYMMSGGNEDAAKQARGMIINGIIGIIIILASWGITSWLINTTINVTT